MKTVMLSWKQRGALSVGCNVAGSAEQWDGGDRRPEHRGMASGRPSPVCSWPGGGGCGDGVCLGKAGRLRSGVSWQPRI